MANTLNKQAIILVLFLIPQIVFAQTFAMPFSDVSDTAYFYTPVKKALERNILTAAANFYPAKPLTRAQYTDWLIKTLALPLVAPATPSFSDVLKTHPQFRSIEAAKQFGLVKGMYDSTGNPTGAFAPQKTLNRAEAAVILMRAFQNIEEVKNDSVSFPDLGNVVWAMIEIKKSAKARFFKGYPDGTFGPINNINRAEGITLLIRVMNEIQTGKVTPEFPKNVITEVPQSAFDKEVIINRLNETLPGSEYHNLSIKGEKAVFFAITEDGFGWYTFDPYNPTAWPVKVASSSRWDLIYRAAFSPDGKEMITLSETGEIFLTDLNTKSETSLGVYTFISEYDGSEDAMYSFVTYTPDGRYIILQNLWNSTLLVFDAAAKDIENGTLISGFPISGSGGGETEPGTTISVFEFSADEKRMTFEKKYVLNLETLTKEE